MKFSRSLLLYCLLFAPFFISFTCVIAPVQISRLILNWREEKHIVLPRLSAQAYAFLCLCTRAKQKGDPLTKIQLHCTEWTKALQGTFIILLMICWKNVCFLVCVEWLPPLISYFYAVPVLTFVTWDYTINAQSLLFEPQTIVFLFDIYYYGVLANVATNERNMKCHEGATVSFQHYPAAKLLINNTPYFFHSWACPRFKVCMLWALSHGLVCTVDVWFWCWIKVFARD